MTRAVLPSNLQLLGFDAFDQLVNRTVKQAGDSYPPFNVEQPTENALRIDLAIAGFAPEELSVQVEGTQLIVHGRRTEQLERTYLHRGIATRKFKRVFRLTDGLEVDSAHLENGILTTDIRRTATITPVHKIAIQLAGPIDDNGRSNDQEG